MPANVDAMVREGIAAFQAGKTLEARTLLLKAVELDQRNEQAWLWLSGLVESEEEKRTCLENVLIINPNNERAKSGLQKMLGQSPGGVIDAPPPPPAAAANPFTVNFEDEFPNSVEWGGAADTPPPPPPPPHRAVGEPTSQEYDDWLQSLNLPDTGGSAAGSPAFSQDIADYLNKPVGEGDSEPRRSSPAAPAASAVPTVFDDDFFNTTFDTNDLFADAPPAATVTPASPPDYLFEEEPVASAVPIPPKSTAAKPAPKAPVIADDEEDVLEADLLGGGFLEEDDFDEEMEELELEEYLKYIPEGIKATRLPGSDESQPFSLKFGLIVLVLMNIGAAAFFALQVMG